MKKLRPVTKWILALALILSTASCTTAYYETYDHSGPRFHDDSEVNAVLRPYHDDVAALRRYLIDEGLLGREAGVYWRTGGWVDVLT